MCGIAGFSMHPSSTVNTRELAHNLLTAIQTRGSDASGFSYVKGNVTSVYKRPTPGSELPLHDLPRRADAAILHTRFATQGHQSINRNNHPVISPSGNISLVHNGVISNDFEFRGEGPDEFMGLPAVDSSVIPALIERDGINLAAAQLEGYAAIAWLDTRDADSRLHLARLDYSPVAWTWLLDGSFVFASTKPLLAGALAMSGLDHGHIFDMPEEMYLQVVNGIIMESEDGVKMQEDWFSRARFGNATAGGHPSESSSNVYGIGSSFGNIDFDDDFDDKDSNPNYEYNPSTGLYDRISEWDKDYRNSSRVTTDPDEIAMAMAPESNKRQVWKPNADGELELSFEVSNDLQGYYIELEDSTLDYHDSLESLEAQLDFLANIDLWEDAPFPTASKQLRWTNFVIDMGEITASRGMESWLKDLSMIDAHESRGVYNLQYVREGLQDIITLAAI